MYGLILLLSVIVSMSTIQTLNFIKVSKNISLIQDFNNILNMQTLGLSNVDTTRATTILQERLMYTNMLDALGYADCEQLLIQICKSVDSIARTRCGRFPDNTTPYIYLISRGSNNVTNDVISNVLGNTVYSRPESINIDCTNDNTIRNSIINYGRSLLLYRSNGLYVYNINGNIVRCLDLRYNLDGIAFKNNSLDCAITEIVTNN